MGEAGGLVPGMVGAFIASDFVQERFDGIGAVSDYGLRQYDFVKLGVVNHITAGTGSIDVLTDWFKNGDTGASHFGIGRETAGMFAFGAIRFPVAPVHQYVPTTGKLAPWAQGVRQWADNPNCDIKVPAHLRALPPGAANPAFISIENVARAGTDGVTDAQFNSNVLLRAWAAAYFRFPINPETQLWHAEFDPFNRCYDTGWDGALEDEMQAAAHKLLRGDATGLRQVTSATQPAAGLTEAQVRAIVREEVAKDLSDERINDALVLRMKLTRIVWDPDFSQAEKAADALRAAGFDL